MVKASNSAFLYKLINYRIITAFISIILGITIAYFISFINALRFNHPVYFIPSVYIVAIMLFIVYFESILYINRIVDKKISWVSNPEKRFLTQLIITTPYAVIFWLIASLFVTFVIAGDDVVDGIELLIYLTIALLLSITHNTIRYFFHTFTRNKEHEIKKLIFEKEDVKQKYSNLKDQLSPHFLFNNLNTLYGLITEKSDLAADFVLKLSEVYRYLLINKDKEVVSVKLELNFIESYMELLKIRYGENLVVKVDIDIDTSSCYVPPLTLQSLVENVQKHNLIESEKPLTIRIFNISNKMLAVENTLDKKPESNLSLRTGLASLKKRYSYLSDRQIEVYTNSEIFRVKVPLIQL